MVHPQRMIRRRRHILWLLKLHQPTAGSLHCVCGEGVALHFCICYAMPGTHIAYPAGYHMMSFGGAASRLSDGGGGSWAQRTADIITANQVGSHC